MAKAPTPYRESKTGKFICKSQQEYKGVSWKCTGSSRKSAEEAKYNWQKNYEKKIAEIDGKIEVKLGRIRLEQAMREWYSTYILRKRTNGRARSQQTISTDMIQMGQIFQELGNIQVCDLDTDVLQRYFNGLADRGVKKDTIRKRWILLNMFCARTFKNQSPMLGCEKPEAVDEAPILDGEDEEEINAPLAYTDEEMERLTRVLLREPEGRDKEQALERGRLLVVILWHFLRVGEAVELRVKDIDFEEDKIKIRRQYDEAHKLVAIPKDNSKRTIPICGLCREILKKACEGKEPEDLVFAGDSGNAHGGRILRGATRDTLTKACIKANVARHVVHDLRHDGISYYVRQRAKPQSIQKWAGHKSIMITLSVYYRQTPEDDPEDRALMTNKANFFVI